MSVNPIVLYMEKICYWKCAIIPIFLINHLFILLGNVAFRLENKGSLSDT